MTYVVGWFKKRIGKAIRDNVSIRLTSATTDYRQRPAGTHGVMHVSIVVKCNGTNETLRIVLTPTQARNLAKGLEGSAQHCLDVEDKLFLQDLMRT